jgi:hypothetical protein
MTRSRYLPPSAVPIFMYRETQMYVNMLSRIWKLAALCKNEDIELDQAPHVIHGYLFPFQRVRHGCFFTHRTAVRTYL